MTSKILYVFGMKTKSEFDDIYLDFIRKYGIPSALRSDNAKSEVRTGASDNLLFPAQDYLAHVHNLSANRPPNCKISEQVSSEGGIHIYHILKESQIIYEIH
jgi:hypothetical protein